MSDEIDIVEDPDYGYKKVDPMPEPEEIADFYQESYYDEQEASKRLQRLQEEGEEAKREREWKDSTIYTDIAEVLESNVGGTGSILDIGSGSGEFLAFMSERGWEVQGIEPSETSAEMAREKGVPVESTTVQQYDTDTEYDVVSLMNLLEHVPEPEEVLSRVRSFLKDDGFLVAKVPNDFNRLQEAAVREKGIERYWIRHPIHVNYFDFESLGTLLSGFGFEVIHQQTDFPMALFLLMGYNYIEDEDVGPKCHWGRVDFEQAVSDDLRRSIYECFSEQGIGRACIVVSQKK